MSTLPRNLTFRESHTSFSVVVLQDNKEIFRSSEYRKSAEWAQSRFNLTDPELIALYNDYKANLEE